jgi:predicted dehydrogenase
MQLHSMYLPIQPICEKAPRSAMGTITLFLVLIVSTVVGQPLRVGIAGLSHDHVIGIMNQYQKGNVVIVGIAEADQDLVDRYKKKYQLPDSLFFRSVGLMLNHIRPDVVLAYNPIADHLAVVEACAPKGVSVMVEKPLATTTNQSERMAALAKQYHTQVLTNYETTWYATNQQVFSMIHQEQTIGGITKMIVHSGHQGPREIGCSLDFLGWLTDSVKNGGGAIMDFGCYGANLMTWLMRGAAPISVTAITRHLKPNLYPQVDDDATILLEYADATGIIEASWNWPFGIKDLEVYGQKGYLHALNASELQERNVNSYYPVTVRPTPYVDNLSYLAALLRGAIHPVNDLSSLENNLIVVKILEAARKSAKEGRKVLL